MKSFKFQSDSINTERGIIYKADFMDFKFQSDSINTLLTRFITPFSKSFKFQSDSINTQTEINIPARVRTLNSNLILLIPP